MRRNALNMFSRLRSAFKSASQSAGSTTEDTTWQSHYEFTNSTVLHNGRNGTIFDSYYTSKSPQHVVVKIPHKGQNGRGEADLLKEVMSTCPSHIVRCYGEFVTEDNRTGLVFEKLDETLEKYLNNKPMRMRDIQHIVGSLAKGLIELENKAIIHANITPKHIMLVDQTESPLELKFIDFAAAVSNTTAHQGRKPGSVGYMSPEMMLGLPLTKATDVWSLGCVLAFIILGHPLFSTNSESNALKSILKMIGQPSQDILDKALYTAEFYEKVGNLWKFKDTSTVKMGLRKFESLDKLKRVKGPKWFNRHAREHREMCVDLLKKMLQFNPEHRITAEEILQHPFITDKGQRSSIFFRRNNKIFPNPRPDPQPENKLSQHIWNYEVFKYKHDIKLGPCIGASKTEQYLHNNRILEEIKQIDLEKCKLMDAVEIERLMCKYRKENTKACVESEQRKCDETLMAKEKIQETLRSVKQTVEALSEEENSLQSEIEMLTGELSIQAKITHFFYTAFGPQWETVFEKGELVVAAVLHEFKLKLIQRRVKRGTDEKTSHEQCEKDISSIKEEEEEMKLKHAEKTNELKLAKLHIQEQERKICVFETSSDVADQTLKDMSEIISNINKCAMTPQIINLPSDMVKDMMMDTMKATVKDMETKALKLLHQIESIPKTFVKMKTTERKSRKRLELQRNRRNTEKKIGKD